MIVPMLSGIASRQVRVAEHDENNRWAGGRFSTRFDTVQLNMIKTPRNIPSPAKPERG